MKLTQRARTIAALAVALVPASEVAAQSRIDIRPLESVTLTTQQFLNGDTHGKPVTLGSELRLPTAAAPKIPAVILIHGSGGIGAYNSRWADELNAMGVAALLLDSFGGRGIDNTANDQSVLDSVDMMIDAYRALGMLARDPRIDPNRIAVMGFSKGAVAAVYSSNARFTKMYAPSGIQFAAHIGMYTPCYTTYRDDDKLTGKPVRLFHGAADDRVSIAPCRHYVRRLKTKGADITLTEYAGASHSYDNFLLSAQPQLFPQGQTMRNCRLSEGPNGVVLNTGTGQSFSYGDACVERGAHLAYNEAAAVATKKSVKQFLATLFKLTT